MEDTLNSNGVNPANDDNVSNPGIDPTEHIPPVKAVSSSDGNPEDLESRWLRWKCLNCGYLYEGVHELKKCPRCGNENPDLFEDAA